MRCHAGVGHTNHNALAGDAQPMHARRAQHDRYPVRNVEIRVCVGVYIGNWRNRRYRKIGWRTRDHRAFDQRRKFLGRAQERLLGILVGCHERDFHAGSDLGLLLFQLRTEEILELLGTATDLHRLFAGRLFVNREPGTGQRVFGVSDIACVRRKLGHIFTGDLNGFVKERVWSQRTR